MPSSARPCLPALALAAVAACGGTDLATDPGGPYPGVSSALTIRLDAIPNYSAPDYPRHYDGAALDLDNTPATNPVTDAGALLGRVLFYDRQLSINGTVSCATCHIQARGFTDPDSVSLGFDGASRTTRHSMRLLNARFYELGSAFWDRRAATIEAQVTQPIRDPVEMGFDPAHGGMDSLLRRMGSLAYYPELFGFAYGGDRTISEARMQQALAQFVRSLVSVNSKFDREYALAYDPARPRPSLEASFSGFTAEENRGKFLFLVPPTLGGAGCAACHLPPTFSLALDSESNGLDAGQTTIFKAPSLKSVALTGPYMHDGRFRTLDQVVEHYASGVQDGPVLDPRLRVSGGGPRRLTLTAEDKAALAAFLRTLTDSPLARDRRFADPFRR